MAKTEQSVDQVLSDAVKRGGTNIGAMEVKQMMSQMDAQPQQEEQQPEEKQTPDSPFLPEAGKASWYTGGYRFQPLQTTGASHDSVKDLIEGVASGAWRDIKRSTIQAKHPRVRAVGNWLAGLGTRPETKEERKERITHGLISPGYGEGKSKSWKVGEAIGEVFVPSDQSEVAMEGLLTAFSGPIGAGLKKVGGAAWRGITYKPFTIVDPTDKTVDAAVKAAGHVVDEDLSHGMPVVQGASDKPVLPRPIDTKMDVSLAGRDDYGVLEFPTIDEW